MANFYNPKFKDLSELISFGDNAIEYATDAQVLDTLINKMKDIYGNDIDIASETEDGEWMAQLANLYSKIFGVIAKFSHMLNPDEASGKYLDICCAFSNIFRREATKSTCYISFKYIGFDEKVYVDTSNVNRQYVSVIDTAGKEWVWEEIKSTDNPNFDSIFVNGKTYTKLFTCSEFGEIELKQNASVEIIDRTTNAKVNELTVVEDCFLGQNEESDMELRNRKTLEQGSASNTTLSGLLGSLREIHSISDVMIYNNYSGSTVTPDYGDGQSIDNHTIYVCLRYDGQTIPDKMEIAKTIYNKLTPGIGTQEVTADGLSLAAEQLVGNEMIYWKICQPKCIKTELKILVNTSFASSGDITSSKISNANTKKITKCIYDYIDTLGFKQNLTIGGILNAINQYSPADGNNNMIYVAVSGEFTENVDTQDNETSFADKGNTKNYQNCNYTYFDYKEKVKKYNGTDYVDAYTVSYEFADNTSSVGGTFDGYREITLTITHTS